MRTKRILGILLALVMVAVCGCTKEEPKKPVEEEKPVYTVREGFVTDLEDLIKLEYSNNEKTIVMENIDDAWFRDGDTEVWINQTLMYNIVKTAGQMAYIEEVKDVKSLADYGLENPAYTIKMENADGFIVYLYIGNAEGENECYVTTDDKEKVYKVSNAIIGLLEFDDEKLLATEVDPMQYLKDMTEEEENLSGEDGIIQDDTPLQDDNATENPAEDNEPIEPENSTEQEGGEEQE